MFYEIVCVAFYDNTKSITKIKGFGFRFLVKTLFTGDSNRRPLVFKMEMFITEPFRSLTTSLPL
jgi:hypothetical protein